MLDRLHIQNYMCLLDVTVDLGDFTVLIGPNDSGKSSFLEVVRYLGRIAQPAQINSPGNPSQMIFSGNKVLPNLVWRKDLSRKVIWEASGRALGERFVYRLEFAPQPMSVSESLTYQGKKIICTEGGQIKIPEKGYALGHGQPTLLSVLGGQKHQPYFGIAQTLASSVEYRFDPDKLCETSIPEAQAILHPSGDNLASVLDAMHNSPDRKPFQALEKSLHEAVPTLDGITLPPVRSAQGQWAKAIEFILADSGQPPVTIPAELASQGALLLTAFLALAYDKKTPALLLVEEPENGLHPERLQMVIEILRRISLGEVGNRKRQVIVTTHSPLLLNYIKPEEVRVFVRNREGGTQVTPMTKVPDIERLLKEFSTGELWFLLGEEKMFQEQPA